MKNEYIAPEITVVEFRTERGFAESLQCVSCAPWDGANAWVANQLVQGMNMSGQANSEQGLAAGNFHTGSTDGWGFTSGYFDYSGGIPTGSHF